MFKKFIASLAMLFVLFIPTTASTATSTIPAQPTSVSQQAAAQPTIQTIGFRGSRSSRSFGRSSGSTFGGYRPSYGRSSLGSHLFSFGAGWMLGSMFHPFGYYGGYGYRPSFGGIIIDLIVLWIIWRIIRYFFRRR